MEVPLYTEIEVANTGGSCGRDGEGAKNCEIWRIQIDLEVMGQAVVELIVGGVLPEIRKLLALKKVVLIKELEVELAFLRDCGIVGVERQLSCERGRKHYKNRESKCGD